MLREALQFVATQGLANRAPILKLDDGSGHQLIYSDTEGQYHPLERFVKRGRSVSNIESFTAMVIEEARRSGDRVTGEWMTAVFTQLGGYFSLDDRDGRQVFSFQRELAPQWQLLGQQGEPVPHAKFLRLLKKLRPSIMKYAQVIGDFSKVSFSKGMQIESSPEMREGASGLSYLLSVTASSGNAKTSLPATIDLSVPFARGSRQRYEMTADVAIDLEEDEEDGRERLVFGLLVADQETIAEQAIADEVAYFREQTKALERLCVLEDY